MNLTIRFAIACILSAFASAASAESIDGKIYQVVKVTQGDVLYIRAKPKPDAQIVGAVPYDGGGLTITEAPKSKSQWAKVQYGDIEGYTNITFLQEQVEMTGELPVKLQCSGTEPFWSLTRKNDVATFERMDAGKSTIALRSAAPGANRPNIWLLSGRGSDQFVAFIRQDRSCSDGMSDTTYGYEVFVRSGDSLLSGCCNASQ